MPLPRFRIRTLMVAVAAVALAFSGLIPIIWRRADEYRIWEDYYEQKRLIYAQQRITSKTDLEADDHFIQKYGASTDAYELEVAAHYKKLREIHRVELNRRTALEDYYTRLERECDHAARWPWLGVPPDPTDSAVPK